MFNTARFSRPSAPPFSSLLALPKTAIGTVRVVCASLAGAAPELLLFFSACKAQLLDC